MTIEKSGGSVSYYRVHIENPNQADEPYTAECGDIIEALNMDFSEGCEFKAIWRTAAARTLGLKKSGGDAIYDAEKRVFYAQRSLSMLRQKQFLKTALTTPAQDAYIAQFDAQNNNRPNEALYSKPVDPFNGMAGMFTDEVKTLSRFSELADDLSPTSVAMNAARKGGLTDSVCHYLAFPNNVCNKCGKAHDGIVTSFPPLDRDEIND